MEIERDIYILYDLLFCIQRDYQIMGEILWRTNYFVGIIDDKKSGLFEIK